MMRNEHYEVLGLKASATPEKINKAYRKLMLQLHPDKAGLNYDEKRYIAVQKAYESLSNIRDEENSFSPKREFRLPLEPYRLNHYAFVNFVFRVDQNSEEYLIPGEPISEWDKNRLWHQLNYISVLLYQKITNLKRKYNISDEERMKMNLYPQIREKIGLVQSLLTCGEEERILYDIFLGPEVVKPNEEMLELERLMGRNIFVNHVRINPRIDITGSIFALQKANCLDVANFAKLSSGNNWSQFHDISSITGKMQKNNILTQQNFDLLMTNKHFSLPIFRGMSCLTHADIFNQRSFEELVHSGKRAETYGCVMSMLSGYNLLNETNHQMVVRLAKKTDITSLLFDRLRDLDQGILNNADILLWTGDESLNSLNLRIDEMFAYGIYLLAEDSDETAKAEASMLHAIELKQRLKTFFEKLPEEQENELEQFKADFMDFLHTRDPIMSEHRAYWKVIVLNIAIAFTGIGLLALGIYAACTRHCFFDQTHREKLRDGIEQDALQIRVPAMQL